MTETINAVIDKTTKRRRKLTSQMTQEILRFKLTNIPFVNKKVIFQDDDINKLKVIRKKLEANDDNSYCIRGNKIYVCRKKQKKMDVIKSTITNTLKILMSYKMLGDNELNLLEKRVLNDLLDGSTKQVFKIEE